MYKGEWSGAKCWVPEESDYKYIIVSKSGQITWEIPQGAHGSLHRNRLLKIDRYLEEPKGNPAKSDYSFTNRCINTTCNFSFVFSDISRLCFGKPCLFIYWL